MTRVDVAAWTDFAAAVATVGAALTGLLVVAVSINLTAILADPRLPGRALGTLLLFAVPILPALALLVPGQPDAVLGIELLGILALAAPLVSVLARPSRRSAQQPRGAWVAGNVVPVVLIVGGIAVAGVGVLAGTPWGLYGLAVAVAASVVGGLANTWVLLVEIQR